MTDLERMKYDAWTRQLERMRAMQYAYNRKFFTLLLVSSAAILWALRDGSVLALSMVPIGVVTAGMTASFFLCNCDFARVHARALEGQINRLLGSRVLIASEMEAEYFYPHAARKLSGLVWGREWTLFNWFTLHFCVVWTAAAGWAVLRLWGMLMVAEALVLTLGFGVWAAGNVIVLHQWFGEAAGEKRMEQQLKEAFGDDGARLGDVDSR